MCLQRASSFSCCYEFDSLVFVNFQTVAKLKIELEKNNISIIAVEGFEDRGDVSFQMEKLKVTEPVDQK